MDLRPKIALQQRAPAGEEGGPVPPPSPTRLVRVSTTFPPWRRGRTPRSANPQAEGRGQARRGGPQAPPRVSCSRRRRTRAPRVRTAGPVPWGLQQQAPVSTARRPVGGRRVPPRVSFRSAAPGSRRPVENRRVPLHGSSNQNQERYDGAVAAPRCFQHPSSAPFALLHRLCSRAVCTAAARTRTGRRR